MRNALILGSLLLLSLGAFGCSADPGAPFDPSFAGGQDVGPNVDGGASSSFAPNAHGDAGPRPNECGGVTIQTRRVPLSMVIAFDRSNSMSKDNRWVSGTAGVAGFLETPLAGVSASLTFFPQVQSSCGGDFVTPSVPLTPLPSPAFRSKFASTGLLGGTPTRPALEGAVLYAHSLKAWGGRTVIGLVTDGLPSEKLCSGNDVPTIASVAAAARNQGILVYAIGMDGAAKTNLDQIAAAGGTGSSVLIDASNAGAALAQTFDDIQSSFACEIGLPSLEQDKRYALDQVNVLISSAGGIPSTLPFSKDCSNAGGWRYDDLTSPTRILLCAQSCSQARASTNAALEVKLGCKTEGESPK